MSMAAAIGNFVRWRERQLARRDHEPLEREDEAPVVAPTVENAASRHDDHDRDSPTEPELEAASARNASSDEDDNMEEVTLEATAEPAVDTVSDDEEAGRNQGFDQRDRITLAELEGERELARRRTSACVLITVIILFRLWIEAIQTADLGLLMICLVGTSWTARWIRHNREREEELDRRIAAYMESNEGSGADGTRVVNRRDLQMLSFQAQLALAIMESQRQMLDGGFGHPDGPQSNNVGVSDEARQQWERFQYKADEATHQGGKIRNGYGSVAGDDSDETRPDLKNDADDDELPACTICLGEYEEGDKLVRLPCGHIYHEDCVTSWTSNHVRCPLCNLDLESVSSEDAASPA